MFSVLLPEVRLYGLLQVVHVDLNIDKDVQHLQRVIAIHWYQTRVAVMDLWNWKKKGRWTLLLRSYYATPVILTSLFAPTVCLIQL